MWLVELKMYLLVNDAKIRYELNIVQEISINYNVNTFDTQVNSLYVSSHF